jgi:hypothetical protein
MTRTLTCYSTPNAPPRYSSRNGAVTPHNREWLTEATTTSPAHGWGWGGRFGRNVPIEGTFGETEPRLYQPNPRRISRELLAR